MAYREISKALEKALKREISFTVDGDVVRAVALDMIAERMVALAASGNVDAFKAISDRVEGKAVQRVDVGISANDYYESLSEEEIRRELENEMRTVAASEDSPVKDKSGKEEVLGVLQIEGPGLLHGDEATLKGDM